MSIGHREGFYSAEDLRVVVGMARAVDREDRWVVDPRSEYWDRRCINCQDIADAEVRGLLLAKRAQIKDAIAEAYGVDRPLYSDLLQIVRWPPGYELRPHADSEEPDGRPHPFPHREFSAVVYLNDDFEGGQIHFPRQGGARPSMSPGTLVFFPGTLPFLHGVEPIQRGTRYTVISFFTRDRSKADVYDRAG